VDTEVTTMPMTRRLLLSTLALAAAASLLPGQAVAQPGSTGILLLAHGGKPEWNARVTALAQAVDADQPIEVAFGMATRANIQAAVDKLVARRVSRIVAVPLFVSSHSSVVTSTAYLLGLRTEMPKDLAMFAKMSHGAHGHGAAPAAATGGAHAGHGAPAATAADGTTPIVSPVPITMTAALDAHPLVADIVVARAQTLSTAPAGEVVVMVAHGPVSDDDNARWLATMAAIAGRVTTAAPFAAVEYMTVRDDAPKPIRDKATAELRGVVERHVGLGRRVLIVPLLLSFGGIEQGLRTRLDGLAYTMADRGLMPDERIERWVRAMAAEAPRASRR
jgi:sirohydrochlorin cobaltochelatase